LRLFFNFLSFFAVEVKQQKDTFRSVRVHLRSTSP
jgi:hypothetical protein